jgi:hypothetical protein
MEGQTVTLLGEIVDGASGDVPVATLLRRLLIVAARTETGRLAEWVRFELDGYPDADRLPPYRGPFSPEVVGHFMGVAGSELNGIQIPPSSFPADMRDSVLFRLWLLNPIAEIEEMAAKDFVEIAWPADAVRFYNYGVHTGSIQRIVRDDMALAVAKRPIPRQIFIGVMDAVRTRVLDLALELEKVAPAAGQPDAPVEAKGEAANVINTYNFYASSNVAIASRDVTQKTGLPAMGDEKALVEFLRAAGVGSDDLEALQAALDNDRADAGGEHPGQPGGRVAEWLGRVSTQVGSGAAGGLIVEAVKAFFGM